MEFNKLSLFEVICRIKTSDFPFLVSVYDLLDHIPGTRDFKEGLEGTLYEMDLSLQLPKGTVKAKPVEQLAAFIIYL